MRKQFQLFVFFIIFTIGIISNLQAEAIQTNSPVYEESQLIINLQLVDSIRAQSNGIYIVEGPGIITQSGSRHDIKGYKKIVVYLSLKEINTSACIAFATSAINNTYSYSKKLRLVGGHFNRTVIEPNNLGTIYVHFDSEGDSINGYHQTFDSCALN